MGRHSRAEQAATGYLRVRMTPAELARLDALAEEVGLDRSTYVRVVLDRPLDERAKRTLRKIVAIGQGGGS